MLLKRSLSIASLTLTRLTSLCSDDFRARQDANALVQAKKELLQDKADIKESVDTLFNLVKTDTSDAGIKRMMENYSVVLMFRLRRL